MSCIADGYGKFGIAPWRVRAGWYEQEWNDKDEMARVVLYASGGCRMTTKKLFGETITSIHVTDCNRVIRIRVKEKWQLDRILEKLNENLEEVA
jgi:hypothetical protein